MKSSRPSRYVKRHPLRTQDEQTHIWRKKYPSYSKLKALQSISMDSLFQRNTWLFPTKPIETEISTSLGHITNYIHPPAKPLRMVKWPWCFPSQQNFSLRNFHNINQNLPCLQTFLRASLGFPCPKPTDFRFAPPRQEAGRAVWNQRRAWHNLWSHGAGGQGRWCGFSWSFRCCLGWLDDWMVSV